MRRLTATVALVLALGLVACGEESSTEAPEPRPPVTKVAGVATKPTVRVPPGPPPKKLVVRDLKKGIGVAARHGQRLRVQYVSASYRTRREFEAFWGKDKWFAFNFGSGEVRDGWETGLKGMRVGGRRELILPSRLAYGDGALLYIVELLAIEKPGGGT